MGAEAPQEILLEGLQEVVVEQGLRHQRQREMEGPHQQEQEEKGLLLHGG